MLAAPPSSTVTFWVMGNWPWPPVEWHETLDMADTNAFTGSHGASFGFYHYLPSKWHQPPVQQFELGNLQTKQWRVSCSHGRAPAPLSFCRALIGSVAKLEGVMLCSGVEGCSWVANWHIIPVTSGLRSEWLTYPETAAPHSVQTTSKWGLITQPSWISPSYSTFVFVVSAKSPHYIAEHFYPSRVLLNSASKNDV